MTATSRWFNLLSMSTRLLHFRLTFAALSLIALLLAALMENAWLAGPGVIAAVVSELIGLVQSRTRFDLPVERTFRGGAESLPALGVAAFEPYAIGVTVAVVVFALMANGMDTVKRAQGRGSERRMSETLRRVVTSLATASLLWMPLAATTDFDLGARAGLDSHLVIGVAFVAVGLAGTIALLDSLISVKGANAGNVDT